MSEAVSGFLIGAGIVVCVLYWGAVFLWQQRSSRRFGEALKVAARSRGGHIVPSNVFTRPYPSMCFVYRGLPVEVDSVAGAEHWEHETEFTQLQLAWPNRRLVLEVFPESIFESFSKRFGAQDIVIGVPGFDRDYIIRGNDEQRIPALFPPPVRSAVNALRQFLENDDIYISVRAGTLLIKKRKLICDAATLERFIELGLSLYDGMTGRGAKGKKTPTWKSRTSHSVAPTPSARFVARRSRVTWCCAARAGRRITRNAGFIWASARRTVVASANA